MIAPNVLVAIVGFAAGVMAGPCKPSKMATATGTTSTDTVASSAQTSSIDTTAITGTAITTTETATTTISPAESVCLKSPAPAGKACNAQGSGEGRLDFLDQGDATTLATCLKSCQDKAGCVAFALSPDEDCTLWGGIFTGTSSDRTPWTWYDMDCFCDETSTTTTGSATETTSTETMTTELTTSSAEFTSTTSTMAAATTTAAVVDSCVNNEKTPVPTDKVCNKHGYYNGDLTYKDNPDARTMESCRQACRDSDGCTVFAFTPGQSCWTYGGTIDGITEHQTTYSWYEMECFCGLDDAMATTTAEATTTTDTTADPPIFT
ncbi:hypothetical protein FVEN_g6358 [Fusarium venenatum]|uniref:Apple domain-containing protein n=1 Tax=Fusarium venenatum TaxID=56646 RepID=A0A2L2SSM8_9HYPO|nr:uncharacterized protein FVRRES_04610 [Fusarium venenatum]KAG8355554.1 hypothetical protein FVEN_g6358 [Fusarium venenatum]KAH6991766.1 hypothetical protein EDB82DRAFT_522898 [Fusarium venenatum]CEI60174.1 unnamed protein product [Fusarium venenatum]